MDEKVNDTDFQADQQKDELEVFDTLNIDNVKYKTRLSKKYLMRKPYTPANPKHILSFIPGTICQIYIKKGSRVKAGDKLLELDAMKMANTIFAEANCVIEDVYVVIGELVTKGQILIKLK
jgi:biotin carboxyl carrier protein